MDTIRLNALELLYKFDLEKDKLNKIEESIYNKNDMYHILIIRTIENLKNNYCLESLRNNTWKPEEFAFMDKDVLYPEKWQVLQDQRMPKNINVIIIEYLKLLSFSISFILFTVYFYYSFCIRRAVQCLLVFALCIY